MQLIFNDWDFSTWPLNKNYGYLTWVLHSFRLSLHSTILTRGPKSSQRSRPTWPGNPCWKNFVIFTVYQITCWYYWFFFWVKCYSWFLKFKLLIYFVRWTALFWCFIKLPPLFFSVNSLDLTKWFSGKSIKILFIYIIARFIVLYLL